MTALSYIELIAAAAWESTWSAAGVGWGSAALVAGYIVRAVASDGSAIKSFREESKFGVAAALGAFLIVFLAYALFFTPREKYEALQRSAAVDKAAWTV
ncbi:MAG: hypothetical protein FJ091_09710 [Deltaproteobacteria bacterium]|nr:hypothetical protein [Deltaproteobacteria bacterium]